MQLILAYKNNHDHPLISLLTPLPGANHVDDIPSLSYASRVSKLVMQACELMSKAQNEYRKYYT